ncbi:MAG: hypothetical protein U0232_03015 [Thermomicrobiales bacterium]
MMTVKRLEPSEVDVEPTLAVQVDGACGPGMEGLGEAMGRAFGTLEGYMQAHGLTPTGSPRAIYTVSSPEGSRFVVAFPIAAPPAGKLEPGPVRVGEIVRRKGALLRLLCTYSCGLLGDVRGDLEWLKQEDDRRSGTSGSASCRWEARRRPERDAARRSADVHLSAARRVRPVEGAQDGRPGGAALRLRSRPCHSRFALA